MGQGADDLDHAWARDTSNNNGWGYKKPSPSVDQPPAVAGGEKLERIKRVQRLNGCGILEARRTIDREDLINDIRVAETIDDIKLILLRIV